MYVSDSSFRWKSLPTADHSGWKSKDKAVYWSNRRHRRRRLQLGQAAIGKHFLVDFTITSLGSLTDTGKFNRLRCRHFTADHIKTYLWLHFSRSDPCKDTDCIMWWNCFISNYSILICNGWGSISVLCHDDYFDTSLSRIELICTISQKCT